MQSSDLQSGATFEQVDAKEQEATKRSAESGGGQLLLVAQRAAPALAVIAAGFLGGVDPVVNAACSSGGCGHG